jgi:hypothetical protein
LLVCRRNVANDVSQVLEALNCLIFWRRNFLLNFSTSCI